MFFSPERKWKPAALLTVLAVATVFLQHSYQAQSRTTIQGIVRESDTDRPLADVTVSAESQGRTRTASTDSVGRFTIDIAEAGRYRVVPAASGMVYARPAHLQVPREPGVWVEVSAGQVHDIQLRMVREAVITGRVQDTKGNTFPAVQGKVSVWRRGYDERGRKTLINPPVVHAGPLGTYGRMDDRGGYRLYGLQPGEYFVSASGGGVQRFFPGTDDEALAEPIRIRAGEEVRLPALILPVEKKVPVRFRFSAADGESIAANVAASAVSLHRIVGGVVTNVLGSFTSALFTGQLPPEPDVRSFELAPGDYDFGIGIVGMRTLTDLFYARALFTVGNDAMEQPVQVVRGIRVTGSLVLEDAAGSHLNPPGVLCRLYTPDSHQETVGASTSRGCLSAAFSPALYDLEIMGMPPDAYVESAQAAGNDILEKPRRLIADTELKIVLRSPGTVLEGLVTNSNGEKLPDAIVALVPEAPLRSAGVLYRTATSDVNGKYQLRGIAPGSYRLFAWTELEGAAYRNAEFMKDYEGKGRPIRIERGSKGTADLTAF
jgi:hypothetical protein